MSVWHGAKARRAAGSALVTVALTVSLTACGGDSGDSDKDKDQGATAGTTSSASGDAKPKDDGGDGGATVPDTSKTLVTINGTNGLQFVINSADRDDGGFLTVAGSIKNTTGSQLAAPIEWNGQETQVRRTGRSLAGITLVDKGEKKRYYVLRDTDGFPLTTTGITFIKANASVNFFAQFPAPPESTTKVDFQLPLMPTATIEIS
ncbi:hypothetical protein [Streptomyces paludis]|uniref:Secreted protein n=1 Tax=Streptomyces paludis TaxID=2282738 RepID=A0A345HTJ7_9ACTN|nr:hypothetical protein [Streptomyces paludis]AXG80021.1 hypothetical protein DVK44_22855 [Streptomyces paludis]